MGGNPFGEAFNRQLSGLSGFGQAAMSPEDHARHQMEQMGLQGGLGMQNATQAMMQQQEMENYRRRAMVDLEVQKHREQYERHKVMMDKETSRRESAIEFCNRHYRPHSVEWDTMLELCMDPKNEGYDIVSMVHERLHRRKHNIDEVPVLEYLTAKHDDFVRGVEI